MGNEYVLPFDAFILLQKVRVVVCRVFEADAISKSTLKIQNIIKATDPNTKDTMQRYGDTCSLKYRLCSEVQ